MTTSIYELINSNSSPGAPLLLLYNILYLHNITIQLSNFKAPLPPCQIQVSKGNTHPIVITLHGHVRGRGGCIPLKKKGIHFHDPQLVMQPRFLIKAGKFYDPRPDPPWKLVFFGSCPRTT